jgi:hypothetical protein
MTIVTLADQGRTREQALAERIRAHEIKPGDQLAIDPLWNRTERTRKLGTVCHVIDVQRWQSQTGVAVTVRGWDGPVTLDAGWFLEVQRAGGR